MGARLHPGGHPGERVPQHDSFERKLAHARLLRDEVGISRTILVDDLAGTGHRAYGGLPNMTWTVGRGGRLIEFRRQDQAAFYERLHRNGPRAVDEFKRAEEFWRNHPPG